MKNNLDALRLKYLKWTRIAAVVVFFWGLVETIAWQSWDSLDRLLFIGTFGELNTYLWIALHGKLVTGCWLMATALALFFLSRKAWVFYSGQVGLIIGGLWVFFNDFFAIPGLRAHGHVIDSSVIMKDLNPYWLTLGVLEVASAVFLIEKVRRLCIALEDLQE